MCVYVDNKDYFLQFRIWYSSLMIDYIIPHMQNTNHTPHPQKVKGDLFSFFLNFDQTSSIGLICEERIVMWSTIEIMFSS